MIDDASPASLPSSSGAAESGIVDDVPQPRAMVEAKTTRERMTTSEVTITP